MAVPQPAGKSKLVSMVPGELNREYVAIPLAEVLDGRPCQISRSVIDQDDFIIGGNESAYFGYLSI